MLRFKTIVDVYNYLKKSCGYGYRQDTQRGAFENEEHTWRMQAKPLMLQILEPTNFLYLPHDVTVGMIRDYYNNMLMGGDMHKNHSYTYWDRIKLQVEQVFEMLRETPQTNQAIITIGQPSDIQLKEPPCLRDIVFTYMGGVLHITSFWRSNDINQAFLINQGGLGLLLSDAANYAEVEAGSHYYCSTGSHVYHNNFLENKENMISL